MTGIRMSARAASRRAAAISLVALLAGCDALALGAHGKQSDGPRRIADAAAYRDRGHPLGDSSASIEVTEFSDFECPACATAAHWLDSLRTVEGGVRFRVRFRHHPLTAIHTSAMTAAVAAECAADQGKFAAMHDSLFAGQARLGIHAWTAYAAEAGVPDTAALARCMRAGDARRRVEADLAAGRRLGVSGTPTLVIGDSVWTGAPRPELLRAIIAGAAARAASPGGR